MAGDERPRALALLKGGSFGKAKDGLRDAGYYEDMHYTAAAVRVSRAMLTGIRSANDDRELLGEIAKQLVIIGISFRLVTGR